MIAATVAVLVALGLVALWGSERERRRYWERAYERRTEDYFDLLASVNEILRRKGAREIAPTITEVGDRAWRIGPDPRLRNP